MYRKLLALGQYYCQNIKDHKFKLHAQMNLHAHILASNL